MTAMKILLLEDDEDDYILTQSLLGRLSSRFVLDWASTYAQAIELLSAGCYDICLVDYRLGEHDGIELLKEPLITRMPVIVLTGQDDSSIAMRAMKAGAADYLVKGEFNASMLERSIRYSIERKRTHDELVRARDELDGLVLERTAELREANSSLLRRDAELRDADSKKDEFLAMLAHELRNPLAAMRNAVALARRSEDDAHRVWSLDLLDRQTSHLVRLIDDLLDVSRITSGKIRLNRRIVEASPILDGAIEAIRPLIEARRHTLDASIARDDLWLDVDPTRLEQIVQNLLSNAAKYSEEGGCLWLSAAREGSEIVIAVRDAGIGIAPEKLSEVFELFAQEDRSLARSEGGLGIGLTVVKKLVELHGGSISAVSEGAGKGSIFTIRIPAAQRPQLTTSAAKQPSEPSATRSARILVVDDNVDMTRAMARLLELHGHEVKMAFSGPEALEAARAHLPEVILLDIGLPGLDGYEVASRIRQDETLQGVLLIAISGYGQDEDRKRSIAAGFDHHLVKPVDLDALMTILASAR